MPDRSAVIVPVELPASLLAVRHAGDRMAARGVPPHVTVLFPFLRVDALTSDVHADLASVARMQQQFAARFDSVERREQAVWLLPADQRPFLRLTAAIAARWPDHPPYEGVHDELIAHLTLVETSDVVILGTAWVAASRSGHFDVAVTELTVITEDAGGQWHTHWRLPMGPAPSRPTLGP
jgi:2'-5' RNA ligase